MKKTFAILTIIFSLSSCFKNTKEEKLSEEFNGMRKVPISILSFKKIGDCEIAYQDKNDISENYNYPNYYSLGKLNQDNSDFKYVVHLEGISPIEEFDYVKKIVDFFETDTTYADVIIKKDNIVKVNIYRKVSDPKNSYGNEFMMWKWVETPLNQLQFTNIEFMNEHLFKVKASENLNNEKL